MNIRISLLFFLSLFLSCTNQSESIGQNNDDKGVQAIGDYVEGKDYDSLSVATFAGGCFWCTEASFERIQGVKDVISGYSGGEKAYPTYDEVSRGLTDHAESIQVFYDPDEITYGKLLEVFFVAHDPTQLNRQGPDIGKQYRSAVFYHNEEQKEKTEAAIRALNESGKFADPIVTKVSPYEEFWVAEAYHQGYYEEHPNNSYIRNVSRPKVEKVEKVFADILKEAYRE